MRDVQEERLMINHLKAIRFTFMIQTVGLIAILIYTAFKNGVSAIIKNPLWIVLLITMIIYFTLYLKISKQEYIDDDYEEEI